MRPAPPTPDGVAEALPDVPRIAPDSRLTALNPDKTFYLDISPDGKTKRVLLATEVCLREGPLEVLLCKRGTKEHESILRINLDAELIHASLEAAGAKPGRPAQFFNANNEFEFKPATGTTIQVNVHYRKDRKLHTHSAREWVWNSMTNKPLAYDWVFAGSLLIKDPDRPDAKPFYGANSGEVIGISNFPMSMLDVSGEISKDDANLNYEIKTEKVPPLFSKVWVILEPKQGGR